MATLAKLMVELGLDASKFEQGINNAANSLTNIGTKMVAAGGVIAAPLAIATKAAIDFEYAMAGVNSMMHLSQGEIQAMGNEVLKLAGPTGQAPTVLANALYDVVSAGYDGAEALQILEVAAYAASAGKTDAKTSADALTTAMNSFAPGTYDAAKAADILFKTVEMGKTTFPELANNIGKVLPTANAAGISFEEVGAGLAVMTAQGLSTDVATTALNATIRKILNPTDEMQAMFKKAGFESGEAAIAAIGLDGVLGLLQETTGGSAAAMLDLMKDSQAANGAITLLADEGARYTGALKEMEGASDGAGAMMNAFAVISETSAFKIQQLRAAIDVLRITLGTHLLPALNVVISALIVAIEWFTALPAPIQKVAVLGGAAAAAFLILGGTALIVVAQIMKLAPAAMKVGSAFAKIAPGLAKVARGASLLRFALGPVGIILGIISVAIMAYRGNWLGFGDAVRKVAGWVRDALGTLIDRLRPLIAGVKDFLTVAKRFWDLGGVAGLLDYISIRIYNAFGPQAHAIFRRFAEVILFVVERLKIFGAMFKNIFTDVFRLISMGEFSAAFQRLGVGITEQLWPMMKRTVAELFEMLGPLVLIGMGFLGQAVMAGIGMIGELLTSLLARIFGEETATKIVGGVQQIAESLMSIGQMLVSFFADVLLPAVISLVSWLGDNLVSAIVGFVEAVWPHLTRFANWFIGTAIPAMVEFVGFILGAWIGQVLPAIIGFVERVLPYLLRFTAWFIQEAIPAIAQFAASVVTFIAGTVVSILVDFWNRVGPPLLSFSRWIWDTAIPAVIEFANTIKRWITDTAVPALVAFWDAVRPKLEAFTNWLTDTAIPRLREFGEQVRTVFQRVMEIMGTVALAVAGGVIAITGAVKKVADAIKKIPGQVMEAFKGLYEAFYGFGRDMLQGFIDGIQSLFNELKGKIDAVIGQLKRIPGLGNSPWPMMIDAGQDAISGLIIGAERMVPMLDRAMDRVIGTMDRETPRLGLATAGVSGLSGGSGGRVINLGGVTMHINGDGDARQVADEVIQRLRDSFDRVEAGEMI